jgi:peptidoglycan L-alanyl-D-glutamate endopeptidase CwlK
MKDQISIARVALLHPKIRDEVKQLIELAEGKLGAYAAIRVVQGLRTFPEQDELFAQGRTKPGKVVTNSRAGQSYHNYGLAIDFAILYDKDKNGTFENLSWDLVADMDTDGQKDWDEVVDIFEGANYTWGGRFSHFVDNPHLEKTFGINWRALLQLHNEKKFIPGTKYVLI